MLCIKDTEYASSQDSACKQWLGQEGGIVSGAQYFIDWNNNMYKEWQEEDQHKILGRKWDRGRVYYIWCWLASFYWWVTTIHCSRKQFVTTLGRESVTRKVLTGEVDRWTFVFIKSTANKEGERMRRRVAQEQTWNTSKWKGEEEINFKLKDVFHCERNEFADTKLQFGMERPCNMISSAICEFSAVNKSTRECATKHSTHHSHSHTCYTVIIIWSWV